MSVKIKEEKPPVYNQIAKTFGNDLSQAIFTYGDTIYNPNKFKIADHIIEHEKIHMAQHKVYPGGPEAWWDKYLADSKFRLDQEAKAYGRQYAFCCSKGIGRQEKRAILKGLAKILSGQLYDRVIGLEEAKKLILQYSYTE